MTDDFNNWWNSDELLTDNPYEDDSAAFWAWEGWNAALKSSDRPATMAPTPESLMNAYRGVVGLHPINFGRISEYDREVWTRFSRMANALYLHVAKAEKPAIEPLSPTLSDMYARLDKLESDNAETKQKIDQLTVAVQRLNFGYRAPF